MYPDPPNEVNLVGSGSTTLIFFLGIIDGLRATALEFASEADLEEDQIKTLNFLKAGENFYLYYQNSEWPNARKSLFPLNKAAT